MRLWRFSDPRDDRYARAGRRGSWTDDSEGTCPSCSASRQVRSQPLLLAWEPGSDKIGDFSWAGFDSEVVVIDPVLEELRSFAGFEPAAVEVVEDADAGKTRGKRVAFPYRGPLLHELWVTTSVGLDRDRSSAELEHACSTCGAERWELYGVERWDSHFDHELKKLVRTKTERLPNAGVFVHETELDGADLFRVREFPAWIFCTDRVREIIEKADFSNVSFLEMGDTI